MKKYLEELKKLLWNVWGKINKKLAQLKQLFKDNFGSGGKKQSLAIYFFSVLIFYILLAGEVHCGGYFDDLTDNFKHPYSPTMATIIDMHDYIMLLLGVIIITKLLFFFIVFFVPWFENSKKRGGWLRRLLIVTLLLFFFFVAISCGEEAADETASDGSSPGEKSGKVAKGYYYKRRLSFLILSTFLIAFYTSLIILLPIIWEVRGDLLLEYIRNIRKRRRGEISSSDSSDSSSSNEAVTLSEEEEFWPDSYNADYWRRCKHYDPFETYDNITDTMPPEDVRYFTRFLSRLELGLPASWNYDPIDDLEKWIHPILDHHNDDLHDDDHISYISSDDEDYYPEDIDEHTVDISDVIDGVWSWKTFFSIMLPFPSSILWLFCNSLFWACIVVSFSVAIFLYDISVFTSQEYFQPGLPPELLQVRQYESTICTSINLESVIDNELSPPEMGEEEEDQKKEEEISASKKYLIIAAAIALGSLAVLRYCF